jgi:DNA-binding IscR family transcriptional regulator
LNSTPGNKGGYVLAKPADQIIINNVLKSLGGALFDQRFCGTHSGALKFCTNSVDCSSRSLWQMIQFIVDEFLDRVTLYDLVSREKESVLVFEKLLGVEKMMKAEKR